MGFPNFPELPLELRLQIIEEAVKSIVDPWEGPRCLAQFASINSDWKQIIERIVFQTIDITRRDLREFQNICSKRQELLKQVSLSVTLFNSRDPSSASMEDLVVDCLSQLFHIMREWSREDMRPHHLIKLCTKLIPHPSLETVPGTAVRLSCDFHNLPEVSVIGALRVNEAYSHLIRLDSSSLILLHEKLPNLFNAKLSLPSRALPQQTINDASSRLAAFHVAKPDLAKLSIFHRSDSFGHLIVHEDRVAITEALAPQVSIWSNSLVCLKLECVMDITQFLLTVSNSVWPHLERLDLIGFLDNLHGDLHEAVHSKEQACSDMLQGLITALPSMPTLTRVGVRFRDPIYKRWVFILCMDLSPGKHAGGHDCSSAISWPWFPSKDPVIGCCPLPNSVSGIIKSYRITLPEHMVKQLESTVWQCRRLELSIFGCKNDPEMGFFEPGPTCTVWNRKTETWDMALMNDMDMFIYEMGQYWWEINKERILPW